MQQSAGTVLLIRPSHFGFNSETAATNSFQQQGIQKDIASKAIIEFNAFADALSREGIETVIFDDQPSAQTPDAVFPNNWISLHEDGQLVIYPMEAPSRRRERRKNIVEFLHDKYAITDVIDLTSFEKKNQFLEGTGSIVFDHLHKIAYMAISSRSNPKVLAELCEQLKYESFTFNTTDHSGKPVYHTNVVMNIGNRFAIVCPEIIDGKLHRTQLLDSLHKSERSVMEITGNQMASFAGNMLELKNSNGDPFLVLSETAVKSLTNPQKKILEQFTTLLPLAIPTIEKHGGGSVRCMMAEIFLKPAEKKSSVVIRSPKTSAEFEEYYSLRWKVLRAPWGKPEGSERDDYEDSSTHFMALRDGKLAGTGRFQELQPGIAQVRFVAVDHDMQGKGIGKLLMTAVETEAKKQGYSKIFLQARENAVPFYKSIGYNIIDKTFLLFDEIQHFSMEKSL